MVSVPSAGGSCSAVGDRTAIGGGLRQPSRPRGAAKPMCAAASAASQLPSSSSARAGGAVGVWMKFRTTASATTVKILIGRPCVTTNDLESASDDIGNVDIILNV